MSFRDVARSALPRPMTTHSVADDGTTNFAPDQSIQSKKSAQDATDPLALLGLK